MFFGSVLVAESYVWVIRRDAKEFVKNVGFKEEFERSKQGSIPQTFWEVVQI